MVARCYFVPLNFSTFLLIQTHKYSDKLLIILILIFLRNVISSLVLIDLDK